MNIVLVVVLVVATSVVGQSIPPLQWIQLTDLLVGDRPPALKDASLGYNPNSQTLLLFGGEQNNIPQSDTYLLDALNLTWSKHVAPSNLPANLLQSPPPRSAALSGGDFAASFRNAFIVFGGKGNDAKALSDVWAFDFTSQFWAPVSISPGGPSARWGASGGIDVRTSAVQVPTFPTPNNTFYLSGGFDGSQASPLSDVWKLTVTGAFGSNNGQSIFGSWTRFGGISTLPKKVGQAGCVVGSSIIAYGGCNGTSETDLSCARQDSDVVETDSAQSITSTNCPTPRFGASMVPNLNTVSQTFSDQVFLIQGLYNMSLWDGADDLKNGEVDVLSFQTGKWTRVLPAGDPGNGGTAKYPTPRQGAAVFSFTSGLFGSKANMYSDTFMYGGQDASGNYLQDAWILRAYNGQLTSNQPHFQSGQLQSGIDANGAGVSLQFISACASAIAPPPPGASIPPSSSSSSSSSLPTASTPNNNASPGSPIFSASVTHRALSSVSIALLFPAIICYRFAFRPVGTSNAHRATILYGFIAFTAASYVLGIAGLIFSFTSTTSTTSSAQRSSIPPLSTPHAQAAVVVFALLYVLFPLIIGLTVCLRRSRTQGAAQVTDVVSDDTPDEKPSSSLPPNSRPMSPTSSESAAHRLLPQTYGSPPTPPALSPVSRRSSDDGSEPRPSSPATRSFTVMNRRPQRTRNLSGGWPTYRAIDPSQEPTPLRSLGQVDWLARRRSLNAVGELDYAISVLANQTNHTSTIGTMDQLLYTQNSPAPIPQHRFPPMPELVLRLLFHASLLALCIIVLVALWSHAPKGAFAAFLAWTLASYVLIIFWAWKGYPMNSISSTVISRLRGGNTATPSAPPATPQLPDIMTHGPHPSSSDEHYPFPSSTESRSPYTHHQPMYQRALSSGHGSNTYPDDGDRDGEDIDEDVRQRTIEDEMNRRDVSIVTVPRRKLWITNPGA